MKEAPAERIRIGYIDGQPKRINERVVDGQWVDYLGQYAELVRIPPLHIYKLFGGTISSWQRRFPQSLDQLSAGLSELSRNYRVRTLYLNLPSVIPYLLMARNNAGLDLGFLFIAHSVGSEYWLKQWIAIAPWLTARDVLLASTRTSLDALLRISDRYRLAKLIPLCIAINGEGHAGAPKREGRRLLSIGRIEDTKNIDLLLESFAAMRESAPALRLTVAGEYTGASPERIEEYRQLLEGLARRLQLEDSVDFPGAVVGNAKAELFQQSDLLINLSTDPGETFGYNLIEAKAWGLPVICADWDGFRELVEHGGDGYLVDCSWEGERPELDRQQIVRRALRLLQSPELLAGFSARSAARACDYDYRAVMPRIVSAVREAAGCKPAAEPGTAGLALTAAAELPAIFHTERLRSVPFLRDRLIDIPSGANATRLAAWMPMVKPIIFHFAGRCGYAQL